MKTIAIIFSTVIGIALILTNMTIPSHAAEQEPAKVLRHVVAFKFKDLATPDQIQEVVDAFVALKKTIPKIKKLEWGVNNSPEGHNKGMTHGFILTFASEKDRDDYLVHPEHKKFGALLGPILDDVFVIDFRATE